MHEMSRVFFDRMNSAADQKWFLETIQEISMKYLRTKEGEIQVPEILFSQIYTQQEDEQIYEEIRDKQKIIGLLKDLQTEYNEKSKSKLNLIFFD